MGTFKVIPGADEDSHTANERHPGEIIDKDVAGKLHRGRMPQRADRHRQTCACGCATSSTGSMGFLKSFLGGMPGLYTCSVPQSIRWGHWMLSYGFAFANDLERSREIRKRVKRSPLGCRALVGGNLFGIDREIMAKELGFEGLLWNSTGAQADRDLSPWQTPTPPARPPYHRRRTPTAWRERPCVRTHGRFHDDAEGPIIDVQ